MAPRTATGSAPAAGFTYLSLLFFVAMLGVGLAAVAMSWQTERQRQKEEELLFAGEAYREAIASYHGRSPGGLQEFPRRLSDLLQDPRVPGVQRHLRRLYRDPMTGAADWATIDAPDGGIMGVRSRSTATPIKRAGGSAHAPDFGAAATYADWKFVHLPAAPVLPPDGGPPALQDPAAAH